MAPLSPVESGLLIGGVIFTPIVLGLGATYIIYSIVRYRISARARAADAEQGVELRRLPPAHQNRRVAATAPVLPDPFADPGPEVETERRDAETEEEDDEDEGDLGLGGGIFTAERSEWEDESEEWESELGGPGDSWVTTYTMSPGDSASQRRFTAGW